MRITKKLIQLMLTLCLVLGLVACCSWETGTKDTDDQKPVILAVSFGSSYNETREATIDVIEVALQDAYPKYEGIQQMVINHAGEAMAK